MSELTTLNEQGVARLQRFRMEQGDTAQIVELAQEFGVEREECMRLLRMVYKYHPRYLAQDMATVGVRERFAYSNKCWYEYTERRYWIEDTSQSIRNLAASAWSMVGLPSSAAMTRNLLYFLESSLYVDPLAFDAAINLLGVGNGVVDLHTGELLSPRPEMYLTKFTPVEYHPEAECPNFLVHLRRLFLDQDPDAVEWLQRAIGSALVHGEQFYVHLVGPEGSGKGTLYRALRSALGNPDQAKSNVVVIAAENLDGRVQHSTWLMDLKGARLAFVEEIGKVSASLMNTLSGGDAVTARRMRQDPVTFNPTHTLLCSSNERLQLKDRQGAKGLKRRYKPLDTGPTVEAKTRNSGWEFLVQAEAEGILAWAIAGHKAWQQRGLGDLSGMAEAAEADVTGADWREQWWEAQFVRHLPESKDNRLTNDAIRHNAQDWREAAGYGRWDDSFADEAVAYVKSKGAKSWRTNKARGYYIELRGGVDKVGRVAAALVRAA